MKTRLGSCVLWLAVLVSAVSAAWAKEGEKPQSATEPLAFAGGHLKRHNEANRRLKQGDVDMLMIGDSITQSWTGRAKVVWDEYYAGRKAVNLGRSGARTQHVLWEVDHLAVENISPKLAIVLIGTNNTKDNTSEQIAEGVTLIVQKLRRRLPQTKILLLAIFPNGPNDADPRRQVARKASRLYSKLADDKMVTFLDLRDRFVNPDGSPNDGIRPDDQLHLTLKGYRTWAEAMEPIVSQIVGSRPRPRS